MSNGEQLGMKNNPYNWNKQVTAEMSGKPHVIAVLEKITFTGNIGVN